MIDSLLYAKLAPKLTRSVNMARLEDGSFEEIVVHVEKELEVNALKESDDLPIAKMASSPGETRNLLSNGIDTNKSNQCSYCKAEDHFGKNCPKLKKKKRNGSRKRQKASTSDLSRKSYLQQNKSSSRKRLLRSRSAPSSQKE